MVSKLTDQTVTKAKVKNGSTLLAYYATNYVHSSEAAWRHKIVSGHVQVGVFFSWNLPYLADGEVVTNPDHPLKPNQRLVYFRPPWVEPAIPTREIQVLYSDEEVMVIDKPTKVPVLAGGFFFSNTIISILKEKYPEQQVLAPVHRLGRGTTGALIVSKVIFELTAC